MATESAAAPHFTVLLSRDETLAFHRIARLEGMREADRTDFDRARAAFGRAAPGGERPIVFATADHGAVIPRAEIDAVADRTFPRFEAEPQAAEETARTAG